jgi:hypothetical protein
MLFISNAIHMEYIRNLQILSGHTILSPKFYYDIHRIDSGLIFEVEDEELKTCLILSGKISDIKLDHLFIERLYSTDYNLLTDLGITVK